MTGRTLHAPRAQFAMDAARSLFFAVFRQALPADEPEIVRLLAAIGWHFEATLASGRTAWMVEELQATFGLNRRAADAAAREAWDLWMQTRLEDVVLSRAMSAGAPARSAPEAGAGAGRAHVSDWVRLDGELPDRGLLLHLSAGNRKMAAWGLSAAGATVGKPRDWVGVFGRRGLPPAGKGAARRSWLNERESVGRLADEDSMPIRWLGDEAALEAHLDRGGLALVAVDDQGLAERRAGRLFGREADLAVLPWALAAKHPTSLLQVGRLRDKTHLVRLAQPARQPEDGALDPIATLGLLEDDVRRRPGHYAMTLVDQRMRRPPL
ncbi:MAG: hypothetical protein EXR69_01145 [Myxococcales bacterium]|nr:hypothetical protein [Myxococcales bacterium]